MAPTKRDYPWLVQRLQVQTYGGEKKGVDKYFQLDYMGSAEFEFGTPAKGLKNIRAELETFPKEPVLLRSPNGKECWFVGPELQTDIARELFADELREDKKHRLKEASFLKPSYEGKEHFQKIIGWWALDFEFAIFKTKELAELWLKGLKS